MNGRGRTWRLTDRATGARFDVADADPYVHGRPFCIVAMDLAGADLLERTARAAWTDRAA